MKIRITILFTVFAFINLFANKNFELEKDSCRQSLIIASSVTGVAAVGSMTGLYFLWYKDYPKSKFQFFNDNNEWLQMDKAGHVYSTYQLSRLTHSFANQTCFNRKQSIWVGTSIAYLYMTSIEIFDGFSAEWGASIGDAAANTAGWLLFTLQQQFWDEQRISLKYSFFPSQYAQYRPSHLGNNLISQSIKDYNAITTWISVNPSTFLKTENQFLPNWLCFSLGYSGDGMLGGISNPTSNNGQLLPHFDRQRQYYFSLDIDFTKIETDSKLLKSLFFALNAVKFPFPAIEYGEKSKFKFKALYF